MASPAGKSRYRREEKQDRCAGRECLPSLTLVASTNNLDPRERGASPESSSGAVGKPRLGTRPRFKFLSALGRRIPFSRTACRGSPRLRPLTYGVRGAETKRADASRRPAPTSTHHHGSPLRAPSAPRATINVARAPEPVIGPRWRPLDVAHFSYLDVPSGLRAEIHLTPMDLS